MTDSEKLALNLIQSSLSGVEPVTVPEDKWQEIYDILNEQTIACLPWDSIKINDKELADKWRKLYKFHIFKWTRLIFEQDELVNLLQENQINVVILKGFAVDRYYPRPEYRSMGDIDFWVKDGQYDKARALLEKSGYVLKREEAYTDFENNAKHSEFKKNGVTFELHLHPFRVENKETEKYLFGIMEKGFDDINYAELGGYTFPILPMLQNGLELLLHMVGHMERGLGLRQVIDWAMFCDKELTDDVYFSGFQPILKKAGLETFAISVTRVCQMYLKLINNDSITWCRSADDNICSGLIEYFLNQGNFGVKAVKQDAGARAIARMKNPIKFFKALQSGGVINWEAARNHKALRPFAWCYQLVKYVRYVFGKKNVIKGVIEDNDKREQRQRLFDGLKLFGE